MGWLAVWAVALGTFTLVTNELLPVALMNPIRADLNVSEGTAGAMVTAPAIVAAIAAPSLSVAVRRLDRRIVLLAMAALFTASDSLAATAANFPVMLIARLLLGLGIGGFWGIGATIGSALVSGSQSAARAAAIIFSGVSVATVVGVPGGSFIGVAFGWRIAFATTAALGLVNLTLLAVLLPKIVVDAPVRGSDLRSAIGHRSVRIGLTTTLVLIVGQFIAYTYIAPFLHDDAHIGSIAISVMLLVFGVAGILGNFGIGRYLQRHLRPTVIALIALLGASAAAMAVIGSWMPGAVALLVTWGVAYGAIPLAMQTWVMTAHSQSSPLYIATFRGSIAIGSLVGGRIVDAAGNAAAMYGGAAMAATALGLFVILGRARVLDAT
jgi:predicted MFS family arabinose efflux permease